MCNVLPRVAAIHDLSGFGRCSLTVIIPVLSSMGVQACPLPTAVLSTHSGGFGNFLFHDLTDCMADYSNHWKSLGIEFNCLYSGFLGSSGQIDIVAKLFNDLKTEEHQLIVVDPVMGDHGRLYKTYTQEMQHKMKQLVGKADIITPNLTEAYFLTEETYTEEPLGTQRMKPMLRKLSDLGPETVVITGVKTDTGTYANLGYTRSSDTYWKVNYDCIPAQYPGTGDIFTSVLIGSLLLGEKLPLAMVRATGFVSLAVRTTYEYRTPEREGVLLEKVLNTLGNELDSSTYETID
ncbi:MAG: pyridoxamine kinase [Clostridia bacterium]|nr:pyridoxamine kinase [Clostridia bacterium]